MQRYSAVTNTTPSGYLRKVDMRSHGNLNARHVNEEPFYIPYKVRKTFRGFNEDDESTCGDVRKQHEEQAVFIVVFIVVSPRQKKSQ